MSGRITDKVRVFMDPYTRNHPEGEAWLLEFQRQTDTDETGTWELWWVEFLDDGAEAPRVQRIVFFPKGVHGWPDDATPRGRA